MSTTRQHRSREGCWTCKARRRKCDNGRPNCRNCQQRGVLCEGYEIRLLWDVGIASRGRFAGAKKPVQELAPQKPKGRQRDWEKKRSPNIVTNEVATSPQGHDGAGSNNGDRSVSSSSSLDDWTRVNYPEGCVSAVQSRRTPEDARLFNEFLVSGINVLHSTTVNDVDNLLATHLPDLCEQSEALFTVCLAFQVSSFEEHKSRFFEYFDLAFNLYRVELANSVIHLRDATLAAGLLLCTVGCIHGLQWTMHLQGIHNILQTNDLNDTLGQRTPLRMHLIEVLGLMDLPTFTIGRQSPCIGIWRRYCRSSIHECSNRNTVELVSGLPRSLLDIFSTIGEGATEEDFWNWPGAEGSFLQSQLWEAHRLAGMLTIRHRRLPAALSPDATHVQPLTVNQIVNCSRKLELPTTVVLVSRILSNLDAIRRASAEPEYKNTLVINAINYPLFVAGLEKEVLNANAGWKDQIRSFLSLSSRGSRLAKEDLLVLGLLERLWADNDEMVNVDELARMQGIEPVLL